LTLKKYLYLISGDDVKSTLEIGVAGAMVGKNYAKLPPKILNNIKNLNYVKNFAENKSSSKTILRTTAVLAPEITYILDKNVKKLQQRTNIKIPLSMQYPAAAGIKMSEKARQQHFAWYTEFSILIKGKVSPDIYKNMKENARDINPGVSKELIDFLTQ